MGDLKQNLIAAKALIDTQERFDGVSVADAVLQAVNFDMRKARACLGALIEELPETELLLTSYELRTDTAHADIMALFDRAIGGTP